MRTAFGFCLASLGLLVACGGSSSETPWPVEPSDLEAGPAGEARPQNNVVDTRKLPNRYSEKKASDTAKANPENAKSKSREKGKAPASP